MGGAGALSEQEFRKNVGNFVFMTSELSCAGGSGPPCFLGDAASAASMVSRFTALGAWHFLLPGLDDLASHATVGQAIADAGGYFYTYEGFRLAYARPGGTGPFDCALYLQAFRPLLSSIKQQFPTAYRGVVLKDEPNETDFASLGAIRACLASAPELADLVIFQNLLGLYATPGAWSGAGVADLAPPSAYGFSCGGPDVNGGSATAIGYSNAWTQYVQGAASATQPALLGFDLYPFTSASSPEGVSLQTCAPPREYLVSSASVGARAVAAGVGAEPFTFLQNWAEPPGGVWVDASQDEQRWFIAFSIAFGVKRFAHFVSHDFPLGNSTARGLLAADGTSGDRYATAAAVMPTFATPIQREMAGYAAIDFAASWLGVPSAKHVASLSGPDVVVGEYEQAGKPPLLFVASRAVSGPPTSTTITLGAVWPRIEQFSPSDAAWTTIATGASSFTFAGVGGGVLVRLSDAP
jgi:hypothetical protein